jgi:hypothetical protein
MTLTFFDGPAGSGKTWNLMKALAHELERRPLQDDQRVLALTRMHGSRQRLEARMRDVPGLRFKCTTFDGFARELVTRWSSLARAVDSVAVGNQEYEAISRLAGRLLEYPFVRSWVVATHPIVVVDELQDSKGGQLAIVRALESAASCLAAADAFQDLDGEPSNDAVEWARSRGAPIELSQVHRTRVQGLLAGALALRNGEDLVQGRGLKLMAKAGSLAAWQLAVQLRSWWGRYNEIAILTPVRPDRSTFVKRIIQRVGEKPIGSDPVGPFHVPWEAQQDAIAEELVAALGLPSERDAFVELKNLLGLASCRNHASLMRWAERQSRLTGKRMMTAGELRDQVGYLVHQSRARGPSRARRVIALTVHQAKNREFDAVVVLWPYQAPKNERGRRLLYNAVSRARHAVLVLAQGPKLLLEPPFMKGVALLTPRSERGRRSPRAQVSRPKDPGHREGETREVWSQGALWS